MNVLSKLFLLFILIGLTGCDLNDDNPGTIHCNNKNIHVIDVRFDSRDSGFSYTTSDNRIHFCSKGEVDLDNINN